MRVSAGKVYPRPCRLTYPEKGLDLLPKHCDAIHGGPTVPASPGGDTLACWVLPTLWRLGGGDRFSRDGCKSGYFFVGSKQLLATRNFYSFYLYRRLTPRLCSRLMIGWYESHAPLGAVGSAQWVESEQKEWLG